MKNKDLTNKGQHNVWLRMTLMLLAGLALSTSLWGQNPGAPGGEFHIRVSIIELSTTSTRGIGDGSFGGDVDISFVFRDVELDFGLDLDGDDRIFPFDQECFHTGWLPFNSAYGQTYAGETLKTLQTYNGIPEFAGDLILAEKRLVFPRDEGFDYNTKPVLRFLMDCFENDRGSDCAYDGGGAFKNGDDHHAVKPIELSLPKNGEIITVQAKESVATYTAKLKVEYNFQPFEPLMRYTAENGDPLTTICEGQDYYLEINYLTEGFKGRDEAVLEDLDYWAYWDSSASADRRIPFFGWNREGIEMVANNEKGLRFRVPSVYPPRQFSFSLNWDLGTAFGHKRNFVIKNPKKLDGSPLLTVIPAPPNGMTYEVPPVCETAGNDHSILIRGLPPPAGVGDLFKFTLERKNPDCNDPLTCWSLFFGAPGGPNREAVIPAGVQDSLTSFSGLPEGEYRIKVTKPGGTADCTYIEYITLKKVPLPDFEIEIRNASCAGDTGIIFADYAYRDIPSTLRARNVETGEWHDQGTYYLQLPLGEYELELQNEAGCIKTYDETAVVRRLDLAEVEIVSLDRVQIGDTYYDATCADDLARVVIRPGGEPQLYYFLRWEKDGEFGWNRTLTSPGEIILELEAGNYTFYFNGTSTCGISQELEIRLPEAPLSAGNIAITNASACSFDGQIAFPELSGGVPPYSLSINLKDPVSESTFTGLYPGYYLVDITDAVGCSIRTQSFVDSEENIRMDTVLSTAVLCPEDTDGSLEIQVSGGSPPYTYSLNGGAFVAENKFTNLGKGDYAIVVQDASGCQVNGNASVQGPLELELLNINTSRPVCTGSATQVYVSVRGGTGNFQFSIDGGPFVDGDDFQWMAEPLNWRYVTINNIAPGNHNLQVGDERGCLSAASTFSIEDPEPLDLSVSSVSDMSCHNMEDPDGSIRFSLSGGYSPYSLLVFPEAPEAPVDTIPVIYKNAYTLTGLGPDTYRFRLRDAYGCSVEFEGAVDILEPPALTATAENTGAEVVLCGSANNGAITVSASGGVGPYEYSLNYRDFQESPVLTQAGPGNLYRVRDANGCIFSDSIYLPTVAGISMEVLQVIPETECQLGRLQLKVERVTGDLNINIEVAGPFSPCRGILFPPIKEPEDGAVNKNLTETSEKYLFTLAKNNTGSSDTTFWINGISASDPRGWCITVSDQTGCRTFQKVLIGRSSLALEATQINPVSCADRTDGAVSLQLSGSTAYTLIRNFQDTIFLDSSDALQPVTTTVSGLAAGKHSFVLNAADGCQKTLEVEVENGNSLYPQIDQTNGSGCGTADYRADVTFSFTGGVAPYTITWPDSTSGIPNADGTQWTGIPAGEYEVLVSDAGGCQDSVTLYVQAMDTLAVEIVDLIAPDCLNAEGAVELLASGGTPPYRYLIDPANPQDTGFFGSLNPGTYFMSVRDANDCQAFVSFELHPFDPLFIGVTPVAASCNGVADGALQIQYDGNTDNWSYTLNGNPVSPDSDGLIQGLAAGIYTLAITNGNGCTQVFEDREITQPSALQTAVTVLQESSCGVNNAAAFAAVSGGMAPYAYEWNRGIDRGQDTVYNLYPGINQLIVSDAQSCADTQMIMINSGLQINLFLEPTPASCGENNGSIRLNIAGGLNPYSVSWVHDPDLDASQINGLAPGIYEVAVTDAAGCQSTRSVEVEQLEPLSLSLAARASQICDVQLGSITLSGSGGDGNYEYSWAHDPGLKTNVAQDLPAGSYAATITDGQGCAAEFTAEVPFAGGPSVQIVQTEVTDCIEPTGSITAEVLGGTAPYVYTWSHDQNLQAGEATQLAAGTYTLTVGDANGCQFTVDTLVETANGPSVEVIAVEDSPCDGAEGSIELLASGGTTPYSFSWSHQPLLNQPITTSLRPGSYTVTVTDFRGCTVSLSETINPTGGPSIMLDSLSNSLCAEGTGFLQVQVQNANLPVTYDWDFEGAPNSPTLENLNSGIYTLMVSDDEGCTASFSQEISLEAGPTIALLEKDSSFCDEANGRLRVQAEGNGPFTYTWEHDGQLLLPEATGLTAGTYSVLATDRNGCTVELSESLPDIPSPSLNLSSIQNNSCGELIGAISFDLQGGSGPFFVSWSHDAELEELTATGLNEGTYAILVEDTNGCLVSDTAEIVNENLPQAVLQVSNSQCIDGNGSIQVEVSGGAAPFTYAWSNGVVSNEPQITDLTAGTYTVTVTDRGLCETVISGEISLEAGPEVLVVESRNTICEEGNGSIRLQATGNGPFTFNWDHNAELNLNLAGALNAGLYTIRVTDANNCEASIQQQVQLIEGPTASVVELSPSFCDVDNGRILIEALGGTGVYTYEWDHDDTVNAPLAEGLAPRDYQIVISDENNCRVVIDTTVGNFESPTLEVVRIQGSTCAASNGEIEVAAQGGLAPYTYTWSQGQNGNIISGLSGGTYQVVVTDSRGCSIQEQISIDNTDGPNVTLENFSNSLCTNDNGLIQLNTQGGVGPYQYQWSHDPDLNTGAAASLPAGDYEINVTDANNCAVNLSYTVEFEPAPMLEVLNANDSDCGPDMGRIAISPISDLMVNVSWSHDPELKETVAENLPAGMYTITLTDSNTCTESFDITLEGTDSISINNLNAISPSCNGFADGQISFDLTGGAGNYQIAWNHDATLSDPVANMLTGGTYQVMVEDSLGCRAEKTINLAGIPPLSIESIRQSPSCFGLSDGSVAVTASGGNGAYTYQWSAAGAADSNVLSGVGAGIYRLTLTDSKGCMLNREFALSEQTTPIRIELVEDSVVQPPCAEDQSGRLAVTVSGGWGDYSYLWSNGATTAVLDQVPGGQYELMVTDSAGCTEQFAYELEASGALSTDLVFADATICEGSGLTLDYTDKPFSFSWSGPGGFSSNAAQVELTQAGDYTVRVGSGDCILEESFNIQINPQPFQTLFIVPTEVVVGDTAVAYEVSWPLPDKLNWTYDQDSVNYIGQEENQHFFHFPYIGEFELGLEAGLNTCTDILRKSIRVVADSSQLELPLDPGTREFESIRISPNPNSGVFEVAVEMTRAIGVELRIFNALSELQATQSAGGQQSYLFNFAEDLVPGAYLLFVKGEQEQRVLTFVVIN